MPGREGWWGGGPSCGGGSASGGGPVVGGGVRGAQPVGGGSSGAGGPSSGWSWRGVVHDDTYMTPSHRRCKAVHDITQCYVCKWKPLFSVTVFIDGAVAVACRSTQWSCPFFSMMCHAFWMGEHGGGEGSAGFTPPSACE